MFLNIPISKTPSLLRTSAAFSNSIVLGGEVRVESKKLVTVSKLGESIFGGAVERMKVRGLLMKPRLESVEFVEVDYLRILRENDLRSGRIDSGLNESWSLRHFCSVD